MCSLLLGFSNQEIVVHTVASLSVSKTMEQGVRAQGRGEDGGNKESQNLNSAHRLFIRTLFLKKG